MAPRDEDTARSVGAADPGAAPGSDAVADAIAEEGAALREETRRNASEIVPDPSSILTPDVNGSAEAQPAFPGAAVPDLGSTRRALSKPATRSAGVTVLAVLAVIYTLYFARDFLLPIVFALLLDFLLSPVVRALSRIGIRPPLGAAIVILSFFGILAMATYNLSGPMQRWAGSAPAAVGKAQAKLKTVLRPLERVSATAAEVERATTGVADPEAATPVTPVVVRGPSLVSRVFGTTQRLVTGLLEVMVLLYFLLAAGDLFLQKLIKVLPNVEDKIRAVQIARKTESSISTYLVTATFINIVEGAVVSAVMWGLGMPNPVLWGAMVVVLEFVPYIGAAIITVVLTLVAITVFDTVGQALLAPAAFLAINLVQGNLLMPMLLGNRLTLNPVAIFIGLAFCWRIWGIAGAFVAVPMLATLKIFCDHIESLASIGEFLGQRDEQERRTTVRIT